MNGSLSSDFSSVANATTTADMSTPTAPSGLTVAPSGMAGMDLNWTDNSNNETGFEIQKGDNSGGTCSNWSALTTEAAGATFYTDATADNSTPTLYCYRVRAVNGNGNSSWVEDYFP